MVNNYKVGDLVYDAKIYDGLNKQNDDYLFYLNWFKKNNPGKVLELCCGTGRLTIPLYENGINITGVDNSITMLTEAVSKSKGKNITYIQGDMRDFNIEEKYDAIFIPFNSIHHLYFNEDVIKTFATVKNHLNLKGWFLLDFFNPNIRYICENENKKTKVVEYTTEDGRNVVINQNMKYEDYTQINRITWEYIINGKFSSIENMDMRMFYPQELDYYLISNGFDIVNKYGDFDQSQFTENSSKQIYICQMK